MKKIKICLVVLLIALICMNTYAYTVDGIVLSSSSENKMSDYLKSHLDDTSGEKYNIIVRYDLVDENVVNKQLTENGFEEEIFKSEDDFNNYILEEIKNTKSSYTDEDINKLGKQKAQEYKTNRKNILKNETKKINDKVYNKLLNKFEKDIVYQSEYMPMTQMYTDIATIKELAKSKYVKEIVYISDSELVEPTVEHDNTMSEANLNYNTLKTKYDGEGVKVAVIDSQHCDTNYIMLQNKGDKLILERCAEDNRTNIVTSEHSTIVTSLICGNETMYNGKQYVGIAPNCTVYNISMLSRDWISSVLDRIVELDVDVANMSMQTTDEGNMVYSGHDKIVDLYTYVYKFTFVKSAGNLARTQGKESMVTPPGLSYNAITVGNVNTSSKNLNSKYEMNIDSSWNQLYNHCDKPDVVAPGTRITLPGFGKLFSGTSLSAPIVTGTIALLMDSRPFFITEPHGIKAELAIYANLDIVEDDDIRDSVNAPLIKNKAGAGLIDIYNTVNKSYYKYTFVHCPKKTASFSGTQQVYSRAVQIPANKTFKAAISWVQPFNGINDSSDTPIPIYNLDIKLVDNNTNAVLASSSSLYNNLEILTYTSTQTLNCTVVITLKDFVKPNNFSSYPLYYGYTSIVK